MTKGGKVMKRIPRGKLFLSGMDPIAVRIARQGKIGLEATEFSYAENMKDRKMLFSLEKQAKGLPALWLHAPFAEMAPCAIDPLIRQVIVIRFQRVIYLAGRLNAEGIVFHGGFIPHVYYPEWYVTQSVSFWRAFLREVPKNLTLALENVMEPSPDTLVEIVKQVNSPQLRLCLDVGHANTYVSKVPPMDWIEPMAPWLAHFHLHNNYGGEDLHNSLWDGTIPMQALLEKAQALCPDASYTIETQDVLPSLRWLKGIEEKDDEP